MKLVLCSFLKFFLDVDKDKFWVLNNLQKFSLSLYPKKNSTTFQTTSTSDEEIKIHFKLYSKC
jgi:hypothetical protein